MPLLTKCQTIDAFREPISEELKEKIENFLQFRIDIMMKEELDSIFISKFAIELLLLEDTTIGRTSRTDAWIYAISSLKRQDYDFQEHPDIHGSSFWRLIHILLLRRDGVTINYPIRHLEF